MATRVADRTDVMAVGVVHAAHKAPDNGPGPVSRLWQWWLRHSLMFVEVVGNQWK